MTRQERAKLIAAWLCLLMGIALAVVALSGCAAPQVAQTPQATVAPTTSPSVEAGDNAEILTEITNKISQVQKTMSTVINNNALDAERRKLQERQARIDERKGAAMGIVVAGMLLLMFAMPAPTLGVYSAIVVLTAIAMVAGGFIIPFFLIL